MPLPPRTMKPSVLAALLFAPFLALAAETLPPEVQKLVDGLKYQTGEITLDGGKAKLHLPETLRYLGPADAETVLVKLWGNPPSGARPLGLLVPAGKTPADEDCWAVIVQYEDAGYIKDDDAAKIDYNKEMKKMKDGTREANKEREKQGYPRVELVGWATPPHYDSQAKKIYWAKELKFAGGDENTLNYEIRILGRRGFLELNAIAGMSQLAEIEKVTPSILSAIDFQEGHRYADFNSSTDKVATYGLAGLVAGGVLAKTGIFKAIIAGLIAGKKFVIIGLIALGAFLKKFFGGKSEA